MRKGGFQALFFRASLSVSLPCQSGSLFLPLSLLEQLAEGVSGGRSETSALRGVVVVAASSRTAASCRREERSVRRHGREGKDLRDAPLYRPSLSRTTHSVRPPPLHLKLLRRACPRPAVRFRVGDPDETENSGGHEGLKEGGQQRVLKKEVGGGGVQEQALGGLKVYAEVARQQSDLGRRREQLDDYL